MTEPDPRRRASLMNLLDVSPRVLLAVYLHTSVLPGGIVAFPIYLNLIQHLFTCACARAESTKFRFQMKLDPTRFIIRTRT